MILANVRPAGRHTLAFGTGLMLTVLLALARPQVTLEGYVTDDATGAPIAGALVSVVGTNGRVANLTNDQGKYVLLAPDHSIGDSITLRAEFIGYRATERILQVSDSTTKIDFALSSSAAELQALVVHGALNSGVVATSRGASRDYNTESYDRIVENRFRSPMEHPLSTVSADVDRASYANVRRFLEQGRHPPVDAVRVEEMINYFRYDLPQPTTEAPFSVTTEVGLAPWDADRCVVRIAVQGRLVDPEEQPPSSLTFLIDSSGSMGSANKLGLVKTALGMLVDELRPDDRIAIVTYAGSAGLVLPSTLASEKDRITAAINRLESGGSTAGGAGIQLAYDVAVRNFIVGGSNRVILATDGDFNVGPSSDAEMERLIEAKRETGVFLTVLGFGYGNLKDSKLEGLADLGNGNYAYVDDEDEARRILVTEMSGTLFTIAKDVKIQVEFNPHRVSRYRLIGYENRILGSEDFDDDTKDAGDIGAGHSVTFLYEIVPAPDDPPLLDLPDNLRYTIRTVRAGPEAPGEFGWVDLRFKAPDGDSSRRIGIPLPEREASRETNDFRFSTAVAAFGMALRGSDHLGDFDMADVRQLVEETLAEKADESRTEFLELIDRAIELQPLDG